MGIVGCPENELRGDLQNLEALEIADIIKLGDAFKKKTFREKGFVVKVNNAGENPKMAQEDKMTTWLGARR